MTMTKDYSGEAPARDEVDALPGATLLEFGTDWCGFCRGAQPLIEKAFAKHPDVRHMKVEDGPGRPLGRSFRIKLWPTLVFLHNGQEVARLIRPGNADDIERGLALAETGQSSP